MRFVFLVLSLASALGASLPDVKSEPNPEKRARLALQNADEALTGAKESYAKQDMVATTAHLEELKDSVELARASLQETGKDPRRRPKAFKYGEGRTRELLRRLDALENAMDFQDRKVLDAVKTKLQEVHEGWLLGIMGGRKGGGE
ncbi:MAG: hypothetical protein M3Z09_10230 [Acidobacteriota bacterium]|nr:hypothetical protein [Acidobacteriota bacterium]